MPGCEQPTIITRPCGVLIAIDTSFISFVPATSETVENSQKPDTTSVSFGICTNLAPGHGDHTSGLHYVLKVNPNVQIYTPVEQSQFDTPSTPALVKMINRRVDSAPDD